MSLADKVKNPRGGRFPERVELGGLKPPEGRALNPPPLVHLWTMCKGMVGVQMKLDTLLAVTLPENNEDGKKGECYQTEMFEHG